jgi:choline dehydrogenase-like flavoprotein
MDWMRGYDCDYLVVGSGFGGAVSALRLAEKGYRVIVLERGRRIGSEQIAAGRRSVRDFVWQPELGMHGFFWQRLFRQVGIIGACGVGGGSLVFGGVLLEPDESLYRDPAWTGLGVDGQGELAPHYETAKRMLGRALNPSLTEMDEYPRATAESMGVGDKFGLEPLAIFFGAEGEPVPDPFFGGEAPARTGCCLCGGCFAGRERLRWGTVELADRECGQQVDYGAHPRRRGDRRGRRAGVIDTRHELFGHPGVYVVDASRSRSTWESIRGSRSARSRSASRA